jgi:hypothetical protein
MQRKKQSKGACAYCGQEYAKAGMTKHLPVCSKRREQITEIEKKGGTPETLYHLRAQDAYGGDFWLDLEVRGTATLKDIDYYLRAIWLECCGHLSRFSFGRGWGEEISMRRRVQDVFAPDVELTHIYDFGTSSETLLKFVDTRKGRPTTAKPIALMARNRMPEAFCAKCGEPATHFCQECLYEDDTTGMLCAKHAKKHPHDDYGGPIPLVNSPRLGMCGYDGPAEPPY